MVRKAEQVSRVQWTECKVIFSPTGLILNSFVPRSLSRVSYLVFFSAPLVNVNLAVMRSRVLAVYLVFDL